MRDSLFKTNTLFCILALLFLLSCSSGKSDQSSQQSPGQSPESSRLSFPKGSPAEGSYGIEIVPSNATKASRLYVVPKGFDLAGASIEWLVNGEPVPNPKPNEFDASTVKKGDQIEARATIHGSEIVSNIVRIGNSPPEISRVKIIPEVFTTGDSLGVDVTGTDRDGDEVSFSYEWTKNGEPVGSGRQLNVPIQRGDKISVKITPFDGTDYGRVGTLHREILNLPPIITDAGKYTFDGKRYTHQIRAGDPDGDRLTYALKSAPAGMNIDAASGLILWDVPPHFTGKASFTVSVSDGHGGEATQPFTLDITEEQKK